MIVDPTTSTQVGRVAGARRRNRRQPQLRLPGDNSGITREFWMWIAGVDILLILKQKIIALDKCPVNYSALWRQAVAEANHAGQSSDPLVCKGAEIALALLSNTTQSPLGSGKKHENSPKNGHSICPLLCGQWDTLVSNIPQSSVKIYEEEGLRIPHNHIVRQEVFEEN